MNRDGCRACNRMTGIIAALFHLCFKASKQAHFLPFEVMHG